MEGFGQTPKAALEDPAVYAAARYAAGGEPSLPTENSDNSGLSYMLGPRPAGNQFDPHYRLVLTRLAAIDSGRRTLYRDGPVALEQRSWPLMYWSLRVFRRRSPAQIRPALRGSRGRCRCG